MLLADVIANCLMADVIAKYVMADVVVICGRWNSHFMWLADVIALWQMELPHGWNVGRSYCLGGRWNSYWVNYFSFSSLLLIRTSSHKWGRWYLSMFLFRDGLLPLMNIDSLISLERFCSSLPTMLKLSSEVVLPEVLLWSCMGGPSDVVCISLQMFLMFPQYTPHHIPTYHIWTYRLCHSFLLCGLYPLEPPIHLSKSFHSWSALVCHTFCQCSWNFHLIPYCKELWWKFCSCCCFCCLVVVSIGFWSIVL